MKTIITLFIAAMVSIPAICFGQITPSSSNQNKFVKNVYPNPVKGGDDLTVEFTNPSAIFTQDIIVFREDGYRISYWKTNAFGKVVLHIPKFKTSTYFIKIPSPTDPTQTVTYKVIVLP